MTITDNMSMVESYAFWNWWFRTHPAKAGIFEDYIWPHQLKLWNNMLAGRECPFCHGDRFVQLAEPIIINIITTQRVYCACLVLEQMETKYQYESVFTKQTLFSIKPYGVAAKETKFIVKEAEAFINSPAMWVYLYGGYGSAKTHILTSIKTSLRGLALYITASEFAQHVFKATGEHRLDELLDEVANVPVLLIDDLGTEYSKNSEYLYSAFYNVINRRYALRAKAPIFVTSNVTQQAMLQHGDENMRRIATRLSDVDLVIPLVSKQEDYRRRET